MRAQHDVACWVCRRVFLVDAYAEAAPCPKCGTVHGWHEGYVPSQEYVARMVLARDRVHALEAENDALRRQVEGLADRVAGQSQMMSILAEKGGVA